MRKQFVTFSRKDLILEGKRKTSTATVFLVSSYSKSWFVVDSISDMNPLTDIFRAFVYLIISTSFS